MPQVGKKSFGYSSAGKKKAKAYAVKTGKPMKFVSQIDFYNFMFGEEFNSFLLLNCELRSAFDIFVVFGFYTFQVLLCLSNLLLHS